MVTGATEGPLADGPVVVFDGVCNLCNRAVDFIMHHDSDEVFRVAANQSDAATRLLGDDAVDLDTIAL
ncbi:MAG: DCC1-like thiol-disulfide oxidoreductase family protein, partial [Actinomycetota bacterium]|nr:DCC1-like thiol-disulfide oxidoreductase family protein [Actinomycetota bacterium]